MQVSATNRKIGDLIVELAEKKLVPNPHFQRRLVWTDKDKASFIKTILEGFPFPEIFLAKGDIDTKTGKSITWLVDGQQRITTVYEYFTASNSLKGIPSYKQLDEKKKKTFLNYDVAIRDLGDVTIDEIKEVFKRINSTSYDLNAMEINNAFYNGELKQLADELLGTEFFEDHSIFTVTDVRRMQDTLFMLNILITCMSDYYSSNTPVEEYLQQYNNSFPKKTKYKNELSKVFSFIDDMNFSSDSRVWKKADFFTLVVEIYRAMFKDNYVIKPTASFKALQSFYDEVDEASKKVRSKGKMSSANLGDAGKYYDSASQGTTSKQNRIARGEIIYDLLA